MSSPGAKRTPLLACVGEVGGGGGGGKPPTTGIGVLSPPPPPPSREDLGVQQRGGSQQATRVASSRFVAWPEWLLSPYCAVVLTCGHSLNGKGGGETLYA